MTDYVVLKVIHTSNGPITEAVTTYRGTNVIFSKEEAEEVFEMESSVLRASVTLEMREVGDVVRRRRAQFIDEIQRTDGEDT